MKQLPIGLQSFEEIISCGYIYIDKTALIKRMILEGKYYFLSRPRRFGKSLLVDTLKTIFEGKKALFKGCYIHSSNYEWDVYPIIHIDFSSISSQTPQELEGSLLRRLNKVADEYGAAICCPTLQEGLADLVQKLFLKTKSKVVVLV